MSDADDSLIPKEAAEALVSWLEGFPARPLQTRLSQLIEERKKLTKEIEFLQAQLIRYRQYVQDLADPADVKPPLRATPVGGGASAHARAVVGGPTGPTGPAQPEYPPKRFAVFRLLGEDALKEWKLADLREELIRRGWLADDDKARHALQMLMLNMAKRGEIDKPRTGVYRAMVKVEDKSDEERAEEVGALFEDGG